MKNKLPLLFMFFLFLIAFLIRTMNVNWDSGTHIHPDERFLTMVTNDMKLPESIGDYLNPQISTMNPHNINYGFFVYGTFPIYLVKVLAVIFKMDDYGNITILGRYVSAVFDTGVVILLYFLSKLLLFSIVIPAKAGIYKNKGLDSRLRGNDKEMDWASLLPPYLYSIMVLPIQLSHFFATDTFLVFFMIASFYVSLLIREYVFKEKWRKVFFFSMLFGVTVGLGLASKVTMVFILPLDFLIVVSPLLHCFIASLLKKQNSHEVRSNNVTVKQCNNLLIVLRILICYALIGFTAYIFFRMTMPMAFSDGNFLNFALSPRWIKNLTDLQNMSSSSLSNTFPPAIQWFTTQPILFPLKNMILSGMGAPIAIISIIALIFNFQFSIFKSIKNKSLFPLISPIFLLSVFTCVFFVYQGSQFVKAMRYVYPIYWCLALLAGLFVAQIFDRLSDIFREKQNGVSLQKLLLIVLIIPFSLISILVYPISFLQIYSRPHTRVEASRFMFQKLPPTSTVTFEEWDDPLPLAVDGQIITFNGLPLPMFWPDSKEKWDIIIPKLMQADYIVLSSNRVYGSIARRPDIYTTTKIYYELLLSGQFGFSKIKDITSRPTVPLLNLEFIDDGADESFTVYDHPRVMIFKKTKNLSFDQYAKLLKL